LSDVVRSLEDPIMYLRRTYAMPRRLRRPTFNEDES